MRTRDEIWVAEGTYYPDCNPLYPEGTGDRDATFQLLPGVALYGGFRAGSGEWQDRDPNAHPTILSGDLNGNDGPDFTNYDENTFHVVTGSGTDVTAIIDGFTITAGYSNIGAGMYNESGSPTIRNCFFYANYAQDWSDSKGAGMYNNNSNPTIINCKFRHNWAHVERHVSTGGAIYNVSSSPLLIDCLFDSNVATTGGAIANHGDSDSQMINCEFRHNSRAVDNQGSSPTLINCVFILNGNYAFNSSGGSAANIINCTFSRNLADVNHGDTAGVITDGDTLVNCILWGNQTVLTYASHPAVCEDLAAQITVGASATITSCCIQGWIEEGNGNISFDPLFVRLPDMGADGYNNTEDDDFGDLRLQAGSHAADAGDNTVVSETYDIDGNPRVADDPLAPDTGYPSGDEPFVDMGAYEDPQQGFYIIREPLTVAEGSTVSFTVRPRVDPGGDVEICIAYDAGDTDFRVVEPSDGCLIFNSDNYHLEQTVVLEAGADIDFLNDEAVFRVSMQGASDVLIVLREDDNGPVPFRLYVDTTAPEGGNGASWETALNDLQDALNVVEMANDKVEEIWVAQGTYKPSLRKDPYIPRTATLQLRNGLAICGGYAGFGADEPDGRDIAVYETILSGDLSGDDGPDFTNNGENAFHVLTGSGTNVTAILDGFTITAGNASGGGDIGSGMYNESGSPRVANCLFYANYIRAWSYTHGAGMYNSNSNPTIINCVFRKNQAWAERSGHAGGAIFNAASSPRIMNCLFDRNVAYMGAAIANRGGSAPQIINCKFQQNGIYAVDNQGSNPLLFNCTFVFNTYGMRSWGGSAADIINCTFTRNIGTLGYGGSAGLMTDGDKVTNCILWGNQIFLTDYPFPQVREDLGTQITVGASASIRYCCIQGWTEGGDGNISSDPLFANLPDMGPDGSPGSEDVNLGDLRLQAGSPCIDAGDRDVDSNSHSFGVERLLGVDLDLLVRCFDDPDTADTGKSAVGAPMVDMGAYEFGSELIPSILYVNDGAVGGDTGTSWDDAFTDLPTALWTAFVANEVVDEIWVAAGRYTPTVAGGNRDAAFELIDGVGIYGGFAGGEISLEQRDPNTHVTILSGDLNGDDYSGGDKSDNAYHVVTGTWTHADAILDGFTISGGNAEDDTGAGLYIASGSPTIRNCLLVDNTSNSRAGGFVSSLSKPTIDNLTIESNSAPPDEPDAGLIEFSRMTLDGDFTLAAGRLDVVSSWFEGAGRINLAEGTIFRVTGEPGGDATTIYSDVYGPGDIDIDPGQRLIIGGDAVVNLSTTEECNPDAGNDAGVITVNGSLIVQDTATLKNANIDVRLLELQGNTDIYYNNILLAEASTGFGGEFFVGNDATINCNTIISEGDRYLDLDPDPLADEHPTITNNQITVIIKEGISGSQGTLLELRAADYDFMDSGAYQVSPDSPGFTDDPSENWVLE